MPRRNNIKWRKEDRQKISNTVRQFNAKLTRVAKSNPNLIPYLPKKLSVKEVTRDIATRNDFNRLVNSYSRFLRKGAEAPVTTSKGLKISQWEKRETGIKIGIINRKRAEKRKKANVSTYKGTMGTIQNAGLNPKKYDVDKVNPSNWESFVSAIDKQVKENYFSERDERYKENYIKGVESIYTREHADAIIAVISKIPADELVRLYYDDPVLSLDFHYDPQQEQFKFEQVMLHLKYWGYGG